MNIWKSDMFDRPAEADVVTVWASELQRVAGEILADEMPAWVQTSFVNELNVGGTGLKKFSATVGGYRTWILQSKGKLYKDRYGWISMSWSVHPMYEGGIWRAKSTLSFAPSTSGSYALERFEAFKAVVHISGLKDAALFGIESRVETVIPTEGVEYRDISVMISRHSDSLKEAKRFWTKAQREAPQGVI